MNYIKITQFDTANGLGVGTVLWVAGCSHNCAGCHNPQTHDPNAGQLFTPKTMEKLLQTLSPAYITRLTLSGGDPLWVNNRATSFQICKTVKQLYPDKKIWLYTGYWWEDFGVIGTDILDYIDVLVDGPYCSRLRDLTLLYRGSANQRVIDVQKSLQQHSVSLYLN